MTMVDHGQLWSVSSGADHHHNAMTMANDGHFMVDEPVKTIIDHGRPWSEDELDHH